MLGKIEGGRRRGRQRTRWLNGITDAMGCRPDEESGAAGKGTWVLLGKKKNLGKSMDKISPTISDYIFSEHKCIVPCSVAQSYPALCNPLDYNLPGSSVHWDFSGKNTGVGCHFLFQGVS